MGRWNAVSDLDYEEEGNPAPKRVELICRRCGDPIDWYVSDGPPPLGAICSNCDQSLEHQRALTARYPPPRTR